MPTYNATPPIYDWKYIADALQGTHSAPIWDQVGLTASEYWKNPIMPGEDFESYKIRISEENNNTTPLVKTGIKAPAVKQPITNTNSLRYRPPINLREAPIWNQTPNRITAPDWLKTLRRPFRI